MNAPHGLRVVPLLALALALWPSMALALPITFDLRVPAIEAIDEVNSFSLTAGGLTATLTAEPPTFDDGLLRLLVLNVVTASFGVNVVGTTCGGAEESGLLDGGCTAEAVAIVFDQDVLLNSLKVSSFGTSDEGLVTMGATTLDILSTGVHALGDTFLAAGTPWSLAFVAGNGFSFDSFTATPVPEPMSLLLLASGLAGLGGIAWRRHRK